MADKKLSRSGIKKSLSIALAPITIALVMVYQETVKKTLEEQTVFATLSKKLGFFMTSYWGLGLIVLFIMIIGALITLWVEDIIEKRKETPIGSAEIEFKFDPDENVYVPAHSCNIRYWHYSGSTKSPYLFVLYKSPIERAILSVSSNTKEGKWCETHSNELFTFIEIKNLEDADWFSVHSVEANLAEHRRQQLPHVDMDITFVSEEEKEIIRKIKDDYSEWEQKSKFDKFKTKLLKRLSKNKGV